MKHQLLILCAFFAFGACVKKSPAFYLVLNDGKWNALITTIITNKSNTTITHDTGTFQFDNLGKVSIALKNDSIKILNYTTINSEVGIQSASLSNKFIPYKIIECTKTKYVLRFLETGTDINNNIVEVNDEIILTK
jgi:hypothetical protein